MSPSTATFAWLAEQADHYGILVEQAEDEIAAINMVCGATYAGVPAIATTSGGGFALMAEGLSLAGIMELPAVVVIAQRPGPANALLESLGIKADRPVDAITRNDALAFRAALAQRIGPASVNKTLRILRGAWTQAKEAALTLENVFPSSLELKEKSGAKRRPLTMPELKKVLEYCNDEWRGMVLLGLYTGQRLGDLAGLTWGCVDLESRVVSFTTKKTDRPMQIPLAEPLHRYLLARPSADTSDAPVLPDIHATLDSGGSGTLSRQFGEILARAGLVTRKPHRKVGKGRDARRTSGGLSFHCLRHTATSLLKNAGVSDVVAREIIGHDSEAISRVYTHIEAKTLKNAVATMPDVTA